MRPYNEEEEKMLNLHDIQCIRSGDLLAPVSFGGGGGTRTRQNTIRPPKPYTGRTIEDFVSNQEQRDCIDSAGEAAVATLAATKNVQSAAIVGGAVGAYCLGKAAVN